jgi:hypothetical protein
MPWYSWPDGITTTELVTAAWLDGVSNSFAYLEEVAYAEGSTTTIAVTGTAFVDIVTTTSITYENVPHLIFFNHFARVVVGASGACNLHLRDVTTDLGYVWRGLANEIQGNIMACVRFTPSAGTHTFKFSAQNAASQTTNFFSGPGGAGNPFPTSMRIMREPV